MLQHHQNHSIAAHGDNVEVSGTKSARETREEIMRQARATSTDLKRHEGMLALAVPHPFANRSNLQSCDTLDELEAFVSRS